MDSREKGKKAELEIAQILRNQGHLKVRRGVQYCGSNGNADVVGVPYVHIEVKRQQKVYDENWLKQSENDARTGEVPIVVYRRNNERWKVLLRQDVADLIWQTLTEDQKQYIHDTLKLKTKLDK
jgi:Holliday junction resolvase